MPSSFTIIVHVHSYIISCSYSVHSYCITPAETLATVVHRTTIWHTHTYRDRSAIDNMERYIYVTKRYLRKKIFIETVGSVLLKVCQCLFLLVHAAAAHRTYTPVLLKTMAQKFEESFPPLFSVRWQSGGWRLCSVVCSYTETLLQWSRITCQYHTLSEWQHQWYGSGGQLHSTK